MGCSICRRSEPMDAVIQDMSPPPLIQKTKTPENIQIIQDLTNIKKNEENITIKASEMVGEKYGNILDNYVFEKNLGAGAFGEVKKAKHKVTQCLRAVKIIKKTGMTEEEIEDLKNEIEILREMDHPHILKVYEYYTDKLNFYIVTEFCQGGELFERIVEAGYFSEKKAAKVMLQILLAINYVHKKNIVHRDLKPENILYDTKDLDSNLKIIDFGTSTVFNPKKKLEDNVGTCYYVAPEVLKGLYDYKCDLWSIGVIFYILLCGYPPFRGETDDEILECVKKGKVSFDEPEFETVSNDAKTLLRRFLTYDPEKRINAEQALQDVWIKRYEEHPDKPLISKALANMKNFRAERKIQVAAYTFLTNFLALNEEKKDLLKTFQSLDKNGDGHLTKEELYEGYRQTMDKTKAEEMVNNIMENCDTDKSGNIDYNEFIMATLNREKLLSKERLDKAFKMFDADGNGFISSNEFKSIFCGDNKIPLSVWEDMIKGVDENGDGKISYEEFKKMMQKLIES